MNHPQPSQWLGEAWLGEGEIKMYVSVAKVHQSETVATRHTCYHKAKRISMIRHVAAEFGMEAYE